MLIELGNERPQEAPTGQPRRDIDGPAVTYVGIPEGTLDSGRPVYTMPDEHDDSLFPADLAEALSGVSNPATRRLLLDGWLAHPSGTHGLPEHEALQAILHPGGLWPTHARPDTLPSWVHADDQSPAARTLIRQIASHFGIPDERPDRFEDRYITQYGRTVYPAGAAPDPAGDVQAFHTNYGRDMQGLTMGGGPIFGLTGTATATSATSLTGGTETGASHASNDMAGQTIIALTTGAYANIVSNTSGTTPVYTVDRWYVPFTPGGSAASTPSATAAYVIISGGNPSMFVGLTANTTAPALTDTVLVSEITTVGGGLIRKIGVYSHSAGATTWTTTPVFTANGTDALPVTVGKAGYSQSITAGVFSGYQTLVSPTATLSASGDSLTLTWSFTMT